jgi:multiple sugar transport system ATP-binding protein
MPPARALRDGRDTTRRGRPGRERIGDRVSVGIRPEHPHAPAEHGLAARTTTVESLGDAAYLYAEWPVAPDGLIARSAPLERHDRGETLTLGASPDHCHLFGKVGRAFERRIVGVLSAA